MSTVESIASLKAEVNRLRHELRTTKAEEEVPAAAEQITIGNYLLDRLVQLGVTVCLCFKTNNYTADLFQDMFGVPGDFNLGSDSSSHYSAAPRLTYSQVFWSVYQVQVSKCNSLIST
jgi:hypothetical protein